MDLEDRRTVEDSRIVDSVEFMEDTSWSCSAPQFSSGENEGGRALLQPSGRRNKSVSVGRGGGEEISGEMRTRRCSRPRT